MSFVKQLVRGAAWGGICGALVTSVAAAQGATVTQPTGTQEFGIDAGADIGLGSTSSVRINLPASRARVGFFLSNDTRVSIEPAAGLNYQKFKGSDGKFVYNLELGALYHFAPPSNLFAATPVTVTYVRPFVGVIGASGGGSDTDVRFGAGLGAKIPFAGRLAFRLEANLGYGTLNKAAVLGANAGLSFFTRNLIPVGR